jgi:2-(3-amino-3-carboxypropyl)histidine synthase
MAKTILVDAQWIGDAKLNKEALDIIKSHKRIALFAAVNFVHKINDIKEQLEEAGHVVIITKAARAKVKGQILGCDSYIHAFEDDIFDMSDALLYLGDGAFHPDALLFAQIYEGHEPLTVYRWNPIEQRTIIDTTKKIEDKKKKIKGNLLKFSMSKRIGILVTIKHGQQYIKLAEQLKEKLEKEGKQAYIFLDNTFDFGKIEDYNFIDCWVNTACPRIGQDDGIVIERPIINIREAMEPETYLQHL